jgi:SAM-dependent methyltransferase
MALPPNESYLFAMYQRGGGGVGLDYGCGDGKLVGAARDAGHDFHGVENYYGLSESEDDAASRIPRSARGHIHVLDADDRIPLPDAIFDFVCSNQVLEHVDDLDLTVSELARVTKPGGTGVHLFPTVEIIREPHLGIWWYHRIPTPARRPWARIWHSIGKASFAADEPDFDRWFANMGSFFDEHVRLRPVAALDQALARHFQVTHIEDDKLRFHCGRGISGAPVIERVERYRVGVAVHAHKSET